MAYKLHYSDYPGTDTGPPDPERWTGPSGPMGPPGQQGPQGIPGSSVSGATSVRDFGATGDGVTNDTAAIAAAAAAIPATGGVLVFPPGVYVVTTVTLLRSGTSVQGAGATLLASPSGFVTNQALLMNVTNTVTTLTDHDIAVRGLTLDYGTSGTTGANHAINMAFVRNVSIVNCTFQCRGAGNATAFTGCRNTLIDGCSAYGFSNCAYDHWWGPAQGRVVNCYAETASTVNQLINWNPEPTSGPSTGLTAVGFVLSNNMFVCTGSVALPMQIETLGPGTIVSDIVISGNTFVNATLHMRGATSNVTIANNVFDTPLGGSAVIETYVQNSGTPTNWTVTGNTVLNPGTVGGNGGAIRIQVDSASITGNAVIGGTVPGVYVGNNTPVVIGNYASNGVAFTTPFASAQSDVVAFSKGINFGQQVGSGPADLSKHISLYTGSTYGFNVTASQLNYVVPASSAHTFYVAGTQVAAIGTGGIMTGPAGGPTWTTGSAVPSSTQPVGSLYSRVSTWAAGATLYVSKGAGAWTPVAGV